MKLKKFNVVKTRFHLNKKDVLIIQGFSFDSHMETGHIELFLDGEKLSYTIEKFIGMEVRQRYLIYDMGIQAEYFLFVELPEDFKNRKRLSLFFVDEKEKEISYQVSVKTILKQHGTVDYYIDTVEVNDSTCTVRGWAASDRELKIRIKNRFGKNISYQIKNHSRNDLLSSFREVEELPDCGFEITFSVKRWKKLTLILKDGNRRSKYHIPVVSTAVIERLFQGKYFGKGLLFLQKHGLLMFLKRVWIYIMQKFFSETEYDKLREAKTPDEITLKKQREKKFKKTPKFSIVVPLYKTPHNYLKQLIESIRNQSYENWELCLSDGSGADSPLTGFLEKMKQQDQRIKTVSHSQPLQISENTNKAIEIADGDFIVFADHDDLLSPDALYECAKLYNEHPDVELIYSDEDKISMNGKNYFEPHFKSDFNIDLLRSMNYFCHLVVVKKSLQERAGLLNSEFNGAQDYDFVLRCVEQTTKIYHIPKVLYHWRAHINSTAENPESKTYAFEAGKRAIQAHLDRLNIPAAVESGKYPGLYRVKYQWKEQPLISILIPTKDHIEDLENCIQSIDTKSTYKNYEYIIIENNSEQEETFAYYEKLQKENDKVTVVRWEHEFNYSEINNFGASFAKGEYLLLLNNDTEVIGADCLWELLSVCMRDDVGVVGARLYYDDNTIQHAGVVIGFGGIAGHTFIGSSRDDNGYFSRIICMQDYSAVTAACMMTKKEIFMQVNGLTKELKVAFNDIDYCLKVRELGKLVVYNPASELYHYESKSRGLEDSPEKLERFYREMNFFVEKWAEILQDGDPYYNPNLTLSKADFSLKQI